MDLDPIRADWSAQELSAALVAVQQDKTNEALELNLRRFLMITQLAKTIVFAQDSRKPNHTFVVIFGETVSVPDTIVISTITKIPYEEMNDIRWVPNPDKEHWQEAFNLYPHNGDRQVFRFLSRELRLKLAERKAL